MKKIVAVDSRLGNLMVQLKERGYNVVDIFDQGAAIDVCIYYDGIRDFQNTIDDLGTGVLMINGRGKTVDEIEETIERGTYSSLF